MLTLINTNRMQPPIAPIGLEYVASAAKAAGLDVDILDLGLVADPDKALVGYFAGAHAPAWWVCRLGISTTASGPVPSGLFPA